MFSKYKRIFVIILITFAVATTVSACLLSPLTSDEAAKEITAEKELKAHFIDVGQGDSIFIELPDAGSILIDAGTKTQGGTVVSTIESLGYENIDYLIFTHPHEDHIGGGIDVIQAFDIGQIWMTKTSHTTKTYENLLLAIAEKGLMIDEAKDGKIVIEKGELKAWIISPGKTYKSLNNMSVVLALSYGDTSFLFTGDAESEAEEDMIQNMIRSSYLRFSEVNVLKVAHHGSSTSTSELFLDIVSPEIAVISVGDGNPYGHPSQAVLDRLESCGAKIYRTDEHGTITITSDGHSLTIVTNS